jgi:hypothetical protein
MISFYEMFSEAYGGEAMKKSSVSEMHKQFKERCENVEDYEKSSCPRSHRTDENVEKVQNLVHSDRHLSIRGMVVQLNLDKEMVRQILSDNLGMMNVSAKMAP